MDILYEFHPFVFGGVSQPGNYSTSLPLKTPPSGLLATHGRLFGTFTLQYPEVFPLESIAKEIMPYFESRFYEQECNSVHSHLVACLADTQNYLEKRILDVNGVDSVDFSLLVGCVWGSVLYLARCGGMSSVRLYRDNSFGILFDINASSGSSGISSLSGFIQKNDVVVLHDVHIPISQFPLQVSSLSEVDKPVIYTKLTQLFDIVSKDNSIGSVSGFYIASEIVPAVDEERILFADVRSESDLNQDVLSEPSTHATISEKPESVSPAEAPAVFKHVLEGPASVRTFGGRIFSQFQFTHKKAFSRIRSFLALFTRGRVFVLGCMFLLLFVGLIFAGKDYENKFKNEKKTEDLKAELLPKIEEAYKQGQYYAELNPERAKQYLSEAKKYLGEFQGSSLSDPDLSRLTRSVKDAYAIVTKTYVLDTLTPYFDLSAINPEATGAKLALSDSSLIISDTTQNTVYTMGIDSRAAGPVLGQSDIDGLISAEGNGDLIYAVSKSGIARASLKDSSTKRLMTSGSEWGTIVDLQVFAGSLYLLDQSRSQVWKYIPDENGFGPVRNYISSETHVSLSSATSMAIDGNVWIGLSTGDILKFYSGRQDPFSLGALDEPVKEAQSIYTDEKTSYLYLLDGSSGRVIVYLKKDGSYIATYQSEQFKGATDLLVDSVTSKLYVLNKQKIYRVDVREKSTELDT